MASAPQRPKTREGVISTLNIIVQGLDLAKDACGFPPAQAACGAVSILLTMMIDSKTNDEDYVDLGLFCAEICQVLDRGLKGKKLDELNQSVVIAIGNLTTTVAEIQGKSVEQGKRNAASRFFHAKNNKDMIAAWKQELNKILQVFNTELAINTHTLVADIHRNVLENREAAVSRHSLTQPSVPVGELPPPPPRACFGRDGLIDDIVELAENLKPVALIGAGGIGKTSIALKVLHHDRIKERFGNNRRFIRCDQFPPSAAHLLDRLSKVIGAGIENPEDLTPLRPSLSSSEMILFLDNAETILDPVGPDAREIYAIVEELTHFENICVGITSRISTVPSDCQRPVVPTLTMESACDIFYGIYKSGKRPDIVSDLVRQLDFHALSITLLATVASHSMWSYDRLAKEWATQRAQVLRTNHNESLARTIELSLTSQTFCKLTPSSSPSKTRHKWVISWIFYGFVSSWIFYKLVPSPSPSPSQTRNGWVISWIFYKLIPCWIFYKLISSWIFGTPPPSARELLEVVAFFPQGIDENNLDWLFPTVSDRRKIFDQFCILSLTYRSNGFIRMLAPIRDYLGPRDPESSLLLCTTKDLYFRRLSVELDVGLPGVKEAEWIASEDINVEHLLDVFTSISPNAGNVLDACYHFMQHLKWYKPRLTVLGPKIEGLSDDHPSKPKCLAELSELFGHVGNRAEQQRLLTHLLKLAKQKGYKAMIPGILRMLSDTNRLLGLHEEAIQQAKEAVETSEQLGNTAWLGLCLIFLAVSLIDDNQPDAAKDAASRAIDLAPGKDHSIVYNGHDILGQVYYLKGERELAIHHYETALKIASSSNSHHEIFSIHYHLTKLFFDAGEFGEANTHIERAKSHAVDHMYNAAYAMGVQAQIWHRQGRLEEARSEALCAIESFEKLGVTKYVEVCSDLLREIEGAMESKPTSADADGDDAS